MTRHIKNLILVFALLLTVGVVGAQVDTVRPIRQGIYATDTTSMANEPNVYRGMYAVVGSASAKMFAFLPPNSKTVDNTHVFNCQNNTQCVSLYKLLSLDNITLSQLAGCAAGYTLVGNGTTLACSQISDASVSNSAAISVGKLSLGGSNNVLASNGSFNFWTQITGNYIQNTTIPWTKLSTFPTISATDPLRIDGGTSANLSTNRTLSLSPGNNYQVLTTNGSGGVEWAPIYDVNVTSVSWNKIISKPTDLVTGTGTAGYIAKFSGSSTVGNSAKMFEDADGIALGHTNAEDALDVRGALGNTCITLYDTGTANAHFVMCSSNQGGGNAIFYLANSTTSTIPIAVTHTGNVGISTLAPTAALDVNGTLRVRGGSPGSGKLMASDANGVCSWTTLSDYRFTDITFASTETTPTITQDITSGIPAPLTIEAQSTTSGSWWFGSADVIINAGKNNGSTAGKILGGYSGSPGSYFSIDQNGAYFYNTAGAPKLTAGTMTMTGADSFSIDATTWTEWSQATSVGAGTVNLDFGGQNPFNAHTLPVSTQYHVDAKIMYAGAAKRTYLYTGTWTKYANSVLANDEYNSFGNGGGYSVGGDSVGANTMRIIVGVPASGVRVTAKVEISAVPLP